MKPVSGWSYSPYRPPFYETGDPYICRVVPGEDSVHFEWLGDGTSAYTVFWRREGDDVFSSRETTGTEYTVTGLLPETDYEFFVSRGASKSRVRLARTCAIEGTVVNYLHPRDEAYSFSGNYLCSPCVIRHPDGYLLASTDLFASDAPQNLTLIFRSDDDGKTWHYVSELFPCFWGGMFTVGSDVYMIACSTEYGDLLIGRSSDGAKTFCTPTVLLRGSCSSKRAGVHKSPQPPVIYNGRIWITIEWGCWKEGYHAPSVASARVGSDLLLASSWSFADPVKYDPSWKGVAEGPSTGNIEGTLAVLQDGKLYNIMRYDMSRCVPHNGLVLAYLVNTDDPEKPLTFDHAIALPGNNSKFTIRYDEESGFYYTIISRILGEGHSGDRNLLSLMRSPDCDIWSLVIDLLDHRELDPKKIGFQYVDFFFDGDDLLWLCRTSWGEAHNFHDANYSVFHRLSGFRKI